MTFIMKRDASISVYDKRLAHLSLPVSRTGYRHLETLNNSNECYRKAEEEVWKAALRGESDEMIQLTWRVFASKAMLKFYNSINKVQTHV